MVTARNKGYAKDILGTILWILIAAGWFQFRATESNHEGRHHDSTPRLEATDGKSAPEAEANSPKPVEITPIAIDPLDLPSDMRTWTSPEGKIFVGRILQLDRKNRTATVLTDEGKTFSAVPLSRFSEKDRRRLLGENPE